MGNKSSNKYRGYMKFILDIHVKGKEAENLAQIYFLKNGYHVFSNVSQQGCIDMVVVNKNNEVMKVDVKSVCRRKRDGWKINSCLLYTSPSPRDGLLSRMPSSA